MHGVSSHFSYLVAIFVPEKYTKKVVFVHRFLGMPIAIVVVRDWSSETSVCMTCSQLCHKPTGFLVTY